MSDEWMWFHFEDAMQIAYHQCMAEGRGRIEDVCMVNAIERLPAGSEERKKAAAVLWKKWESRSVKEDFGYIEPNCLEEIKKHRSKEADRSTPEAVTISYDRVYGAWLARCAGCLLGQPVEGWKRTRIEGLLKDTDNFPVKGYISSDVSEEIRERWQIRDNLSVYGSSKVHWINNTDGMPEDDDTNYTILALKLMEEKGFSFTSEDVGRSWLDNLPILHVCTAERVAYINMVNGIRPPESGRFRNAYREYIGAQIRGDFYGYVCPGDPQKAAELAWRDATVSHVKNGIYGEMFVAAMLAQAAVETKVREVIRAGLDQIPRYSRLSEAVRTVLSWREANIKEEEVIDKIHTLYDESKGYDWCHVIPNAMIVCTGLLYGEKLFDKTMNICLRAAFDTDCNCATAGSVLGMLLGAKQLPLAWVVPLRDKIHSGVCGMEQIAISILAERTLAVYYREKEKGE